MWYIREESTSSAFNDTIGNIYFGGGYNYLGLVIVYPLEALFLDEFAIKVGVELVRYSAYVCA